VKGILASYRWRRRFAWVAAAAVLAGALVGVALTWPNTAPRENWAPSNIPLHIDYSGPKPVRLKLHERAMALAVASRFIDTAVARKHVDSAWNLVAPEFRAGVSRKQWNEGAMPVPPYPHVSAKWKLEYSDSQGAGFSIALFPPKSSHLRAQVFLIGLHPLSSGKRRHWVVDSWQAAPNSTPQPVVGGNGNGSALPVTPPARTPLSKSKESALWLLLPVGLLSLIVLLPLGIGSVNWYRAYRARALLDAEGR
jgi:hypothetical protein